MLALNVAVDPAKGSKWSFGLADFALRATHTSKYTIVDLQMNLLARTVFLGAMKL